MFLCNATSSTGFVVRIVGLLALTTWAQGVTFHPRPALPTPPPPPAADPDYNGYNEPALLERQHEWTLYMADRLLRVHRPGTGDAELRKLALLAIDEVLHYAAVPAESTATAEFARQRLELAAAEIENTTPVRAGAVVWKLYNHGFVARTPTVTIAFDLVRGWWAWNGSSAFDEPTQRIVAQCDALFLSHEHGDHAEAWVKDAFLEQGKPVVAPQGVFGDDARILRPERGIETRHVIPLGGRHIVQAVVCPGYQGGVLNNVYIVYTPEGLSFAHTGDLHQGKDTPMVMFDWIDTIGTRWPVDVLMVNVWTTKLPRAVRGFNPRLVLPGHENELGHAIEKRKPHFLSYDRTAGLDEQTVILTWGESVWFER